MLYIKNNVKYPLAFKIMKNGKEEKIVFDCLRIFQDTGNIATTGVTPISEEDFDELYKVKVFKDHVDKGLLVKTKEQGATTVANKMDSLEKENEVLRKQLEEKTKEASMATSEELEKTKEENASLKKQLEALKKEKKAKGNKNKDKVDEIEGF